ncbi:MAG TPA: UPF0149 family protein [Cellvibrionaceae bacterium]
MIDTCNFNAVSELMQQAGAVNSASELHGALCGRLCGPLLGEAEWLVLADEFMGCAEPPGEALNSALVALWQSNKALLAEQSIHFQLMLPPDSEDLSVRARALSQWCHGFLSGFGAAVTVDLPEAINDTLGDFAAIVQIEADDDDAASAETDFLQVAEYVRGAAMGLHQALGPVDADAQAPTVH